MRRFTVAELEKAITALNVIQLTVLPEKKSDASLFIHQLSRIQENLDPNTGGIRYTLTRSGELHFGSSSHDAEQTLATGDLFFNQQGKVTNLTNYTNNVYSVFLVLLSLQQHPIQFVPKLELIQDGKLPETFTVSEDELSTVFKGLSPHLIKSLMSANTLTPKNRSTEPEDDDLLDIDDEVCFLKSYQGNQWRRGSSASPNGLFGRRHNNTPVSPIQSVTDLLRQLDKEEASVDSPSCN
ncbi:MAG: hypothetical protein K0U37_04090 [Gammaproteobacteria bacterium]|nr:hypothetical protein [Gammaproteobacteria bacterium]